MTAADRYRTRVAARRCVQCDAGLLPTDGVRCLECAQAQCEDPAKRDRDARHRATPKRRSYRAAWMAGRYATAESRIASIGAEIDRTLGEHAGGRISALEAARDRIATLEAELAQVRSKLKEAADLFIAIQATDGEEEHRAICDPAPKPRPRGAERVRP